jgi:hypothetical protein
MPEPIFMTLGTYIMPPEAISTVKGKGKVVPVLNLIKHYAMKAYGGVDV